MAQSAKRGRPARPGPRYISGRLKPTSNPRSSLVLAHRARQAVARGLLDPKWASELELLGPAFAGELTHAQVDAGHLVARIYGQYERLKGVIPRTPAGPSYVQMIASDRLTIPVEAETSKILRLEDDEERLRRAEKAVDRWNQLQAVIDELPFPPETIRLARDVLERLCVQNLPIRAEHLQGMRDLLDYIGRNFGRRKARRTANAPATPSIAITAHQPPRNQRQRTTDRRAPGARRRDPRAVDREAFFAVQRALGQPEATIELMWQRTEEARAKFYAVVDRQRFRDKKARRIA